jgi:hypothetical protein
VKAMHVVLLVALGALLVPNWIAPPKTAWGGVLGYFGGLLITLLVLIVHEVRRARQA